MEWEMMSTSAEHTRTLGRELGRLLQAGDLVALSGDLGAGKTCCIQGIASGLGVPDTVSVTSPTYTLIHEYEGTVPVYHFDVYRLAHEDDLYDLGYEEYFDGPGVCLIEWGDRIQALLPDDHLALHLHRQADASRTLRFQGTGERAEAVVRAFAQRQSSAA